MALGVITVGATTVAASLLTILVGVLVLAFPGLLRFLIGAYLLIVGVLGLLTSIF